MQESCRWALRVSRITDNAQKIFAEEGAANTMPCGEQSPALASAKQKAARLDRMKNRGEISLQKFRFLNLKIE